MIASGSLANSSATPCHRAALWYATRGLRVHPLRPASKLPLLSEWQRRATTDVATIAEWFCRWPAAGVGIATGAESGVIVVDVDPRHGGDDALEDLVAAHGEMIETWTSNTANGGRHFFFRHPGGRVGNRAGSRPGIDLRGDGGHVVAPPTELEGGRCYVWESEHGPHEVELAASPPWLLKMIADRGGDHAEPRPVSEWVRRVRDGAREGSRNAVVTSLAGYLLRRRPAPRVVLELLRAWNEARCRPPLDDKEITRTVDSIARRETERTRDADTKH